MRKRVRSESFAESARSASEAGRVKIAVYAGSFDPITNGHCAVLRAALLLAEKVVVAIGVHGSKTPLFSFAERKQLILDSLHDWSAVMRNRVDVVVFEGLLVTKARELKAQLLIRGIRNAADFEYEMQMAQMNKNLAPHLQTVLLPADDAHRSVSGSLVRQVAALGGDISAFVPQNVAQALRKKYTDLCFA